MQRKIDDILDDGRCPVCNDLHGDWTPYYDPENNESGTFCPTCDTHFIDVDADIEECNYQSNSLSSVPEMPNPLKQPAPPWGRKADEQY